jgi:hypothetical protein
VFLNLFKEVVSGKGPGDKFPYRSVNIILKGGKTACQKDNKLFLAVSLDLS